eukprot:3525579-Amphidinium_carterae.5
MQPNYLTCATSGRIHSRGQQQSQDQCIGCNGQVQHNSGNPFLLTMALEDNVNYNWWMWLPREQYDQYRRNGAFPGY